MDRAYRTSRVVTIDGNTTCNPKPASPTLVKQQSASQRIVLIRQGRFVGDIARR
jgi:hypothetical protein